jgi:hypothetical protein
MAPSQSSEEVNRLLRMSIRQRQPITAMYNGRRRQLCPHRLGWNKDEERRVLCYQYGGESVSGLGQPGGRLQLAVSGRSGRSGAFRSFVTFGGIQRSNCSPQ